MTKKYLYSLDFIKSIGILLVVNSHLDNLYKVSFIGTGGALGNTLFFLASGIGLGYGWAFHGPQTVSVWFKRRCLRIYPSILILNTLALLLTLNTFNQLSPVGLISFFIYPTQYFFIAAIIFFYVPGYILLRFDSIRGYLFSIALSLFVYIAWYLQLDLSVFSIEGNGYFRWVFYFIVFLVGILVARFRTLSSNFSSKHSNLSKLINLASKNIIIGLVLSAILLKLSKILFNLDIPYILIFQCLIHIFTFAFAWYLFLAAEKFADRIKSFKLLDYVIAFLSTLTLQIYLIDNYSSLYINFVNSLLISSEFNPFATLSLRVLAILLYWILLIASSVILLRLSRIVVNLSFRR